MNKREWDEFRNKWDYTGHHQTLDVDSVTMKELQSLMTWDTPIENLPPELVNMILSLEKRISKLEDDLQKLRSKRT